MNAISIGPLMFSAERFAVILGIVAFLIATAFLSAKVDRRLDRWSGVALLSGLVMARAGHVLLHLDSFIVEPWRIFAVWQGGFSWIGGLCGVSIALVLLARKAMPAVPWAMMAIAAGGFVWLVTWEISGTSAAPQAPDRWFTTLDGRSINLSERANRTAVVNLWATWCPPCRREMPLLVEIARQNPDVDFIFANQGEGRQAIEAYLDAEGIAIETLLLDQFSELSRHYAAPGMPTTLFLGADGSLRNSHLGEISREVLVDKISRLTRPTENKD